VFSLACTSTVTLLGTRGHMHTSLTPE
jgi:hypothetical protein